MVIHGKERSFRLTVGASSKISKLCPGKDIKNIGKLFSGTDTATMIDLVAEICSILSEGHENAKKYEEPGYVPDVLSADEVMTLTLDEISGLQDEMMATIERDMATEIKTEPVKGKKTGKK